MKYITGYLSGNYILLVLLTGLSLVMFSQGNVKQQRRNLTIPAMVLLLVISVTSYIDNAVPVDGKIRIESAPGRGTRVTIQISEEP